MKYIQVFTTVAKIADADRIATALVKEKLAACVQIVGPVRSTYCWKGKTVRSTEWLCIIKTERPRYGRLEARLRAVHPYELPEIFAVPCVAGSPEYLKWVSEQMR
jgi:periplasmic divalent cation tolerance protein